jgi:hypothetical protein
MKSGALAVATLLGLLLVGTIGSSVCSVARINLISMSGRP